MEREPQIINPESNKERADIVELKVKLERLKDALTWERNIETMKTGKESAEERAEKTDSKYRDNYLNHAILCQGLIDKNPLIGTIISDDERQEISKKNRYINNEQQQFALFRQQYAIKANKGESPDIPDKYELKKVGDKTVVVKRMELLDKLVDKMDEVMEKTIGLIERAIEKESKG